MTKSKLLNNSVKSLDAFGTPVTVLYKGDRSYRTVCGGIVTAVLFLFVGVIFLIGLSKVFSGEDPEFSTFSVVKSRSRADALSPPDNHGQMYIGLK